MRKVINRSLAITAATYFVIGVFGYFTFAATAHILTDTHLANGVILFAYGYYDSGASRSYPIIVDIVSFLFLRERISYFLGPCSYWHFAGHYSANVYKTSKRKY